MLDLSIDNPVLLNYVILAIIGIVGVVLWQKNKIQGEAETHNKTLLAILNINKVILEDFDFESVAQKIADSITSELGFQSGVLGILDPEKKVIKRISASQTKETQEAIEALSIPFSRIEIPQDDPDNLMAKALRENRPFVTSSIYDVLRPVLSAEEAAKIQRILGSRTTLIYPIFTKNSPIGVFVASTRKKEAEINSYELEMINNFVESAGIALFHARLYKQMEQETEKLGKVTEDIYKMNAKLHDLDRLKDDFVSVASHELRTPMTAIRSYAWMALHRPDQEVGIRLKKYLERIFVSTDRLINLVNDMLNVSRIESGRVEIIPKVFDIKALVGEIINEIGPKTTESSLNIRVINVQVPQVFADTDKVHQVLLNIIGNALKFTPARGDITISFFSDGKMVETSIKDSGVGITADDLPRLFKKFGRLDNSYVASATSGGTGLGLYISKSLVELMKGKIWANSEGQGKGTTFTVSLPAATPEVTSKAENYSNKVAGETKSLIPPAL